MIFSGYNQTPTSQCKLSQARQSLCLLRPNVTSLLAKSVVFSIVRKLLVCHQNDLITRLNDLSPWLVASEDGPHTILAILWYCLWSLRFMASVKVLKSKGVYLFRSSISNRLLNHYRKTSDAQWNMRIPWLWLRLLIWTTRPSMSPCFNLYKDVFQLCSMHSSTARALIALQHLNTLLSYSPCGKYAQQLNKTPSWTLHGRDPWCSTIYTNQGFPPRYKFPSFSTKSINSHKPVSYRFTISFDPSYHPLCPKYPAYIHHLSNLIMVALIERGKVRYL